MKKRTYLLLISIIISLIIIAAFGRGQEISSSNHSITITTAEDGYSVEETIILSSTSIEENYEFIWPWIQTDATDIVIKINDEIISNENVNDVGINISEKNIVIGSNPSLVLTYNLDESITTFQKTLMRNTDSITVTYDEKQIYSSSTLASCGSFSLSLEKQVETETIVEKEDTPIMYYYTIILLLIILIILVISYSRSKRKTVKTKKIATGGSEELLSTKKALLMSLLKDVEKKHRAKEISDDTYHKLKEQYKQDAVEAMKQLEDMGSKVK